MTAPLSSTVTKRTVVQALLVDGQQTAKVVIDANKLGEESVHGFPASVLGNYPEGVPLDLNPAWPLELDLVGDPDAFLVSLSFAGRVCRCRVPWRAITLIAVGIGGVRWEHEDVPPPEPEGPTKGRAKVGHLRLVE